MGWRGELWFHVKTAAGTKAALIDSFGSGGGPLPNWIFVLQNGTRSLGWPRRLAGEA